MGTLTQASAHDSSVELHSADSTVNPAVVPETSQALATTLVTRCRNLLSELESFKALLARTQRNPQIVEVRSLRSNVLSELRTLEKLASQLQDALSITAIPPGHLGSGTVENAIELKVVHALRSSNLPFYETVWSIAKRTCTGLVAFGKRFYWDKSGAWEDGAEAKKRQNNKLKRKSVFVDIVADDGEEWVKVSTISETRLLFEMAKKGWEADSDSDEDSERVILQNYKGDRGEDYDDDYGDDDDDDDDDDEIELIKLAQDMQKAASLTRVNYRHPRLRFVIPKIEEGKSYEIDNLLKVIRSYGVTVNCGESVFTSRTISKSESGDSSTDSINQQDDVQHLLPDRFKRFTPTLNVDCTLLLAIVSDLSHYKSIAPSREYHKAINRQIEVEHERPLLPRELWPAMGNHSLVCTTEAARRMREIVETIGTETEKKRMRILIGDPPYENMDVLPLFQELSDYEVPTQWNIPIKIFEAKSVIDTRKQQNKLPSVSKMVEKILSDINHSVIMYGWVSDMMTITSNRSVAKEIETIIETHRDSEDLEGPKIWVCDTARSLIGKEKGRKP